MFRIFKKGFIRNFDFGLVPKDGSLGYILQAWKESLRFSIDLVLNKGKVFHYFVIKQFQSFYFLYLLFGVC